MIAVILWGYVNDAIEGLDTIKRIGDATNGCSTRPSTCQPVSPTASGTGRRAASNCGCSRDAAQRRPRTCGRRSGNARAYRAAATQQRLNDRDPAAGRARWKPQPWTARHRGGRRRLCCCDRNDVVTVRADTAQAAQGSGDDGHVQSRRWLAGEGRLRRRSSRLQSVADLLSLGCRRGLKRSTRTATAERNGCHGLLVGCN